MLFTLNLSHGRDLSSPGHVTRRSYVPLLSLVVEILRTEVTTCYLVPSLILRFYLTEFNFHISSFVEIPGTSRITCCHVLFDEDKSIVGGPKLTLSTSCGQIYFQVMMRLIWNPCCYPVIYGCVIIEI